MNGKRKRPQRKKRPPSESGQPSATAESEKNERVTRLSKAKVKRITRRRVGNQAAYEKELSYELCSDLAGKFAIKSAKRTVDEIDSVRSNYEEIAMEFLCVRPIGRERDKKCCSLREVLREEYETDNALRKYLSRLDQWIRRYVFECIDGSRRKLRERRTTRVLMTALAKEYVRDPKTLMLFLSATFKRWREIYAPNSPSRVRLVTQQIASRYGYNRKRILNHLQKIGAIPNNLTPDQFYKLLSRIGQYLSRDQKTAAGKNFGFRKRPKPSSFRLKGQRQGVWKSLKSRQHISGSDRNQVAGS
jgi:hypothetical protein